jgi:hypothetical protein
MYNVFIITPDGSVTHTTQEKKPDYAQIKEAVGGIIETIPLFKTFIHQGKKYLRGTAYCFEEGRMRGQARNRKAIVAWYEATGALDNSNYCLDRMELYGDVIFYAKEPEVKKVNIKEGTS